LQLAYNKYGRENFIYYIVIECSSKRTKEELDELEIYYIKEYHSHRDEWGYNILKGGGGMWGFSPSEETRELMRLAKLGGKASDETRALLSQMRMGHATSEETKKKIGDAHRGISPSQEVRDKISKTLTRSKLPDSVKEKISNTLKEVARYGINNPNFGKKPENCSSDYYCVGKIIQRDKIYGREYIYWGFTVRLDNGKIISVRNFKSEIDAAHAYDKYIVENNIYRPLNFPENYPDIPLFIKKEIPSINKNK
jgi:group I intron endonuclease